jgi:hypothetical protein
MHAIEDFNIENHGSVVLVRPVTTAAREWVDEHVPLESWQWHGGAFVVEPRYLPILFDGIVGDGLTVR